MSLNMNSVSDLTITEGDVRTIHDADDNLLWGKLSYDTTYQGDTTQQTYTGKNLFNGILESGIINGNTGQDVPNANFVRSKDYIPVEELTNYTISSTTSEIESFLIYEYKSDYTYNLVSNVVVNKGSYWQTKADTSYIRFRPSYQSSDTSIQFQVEKGTTPTAYEPYVGGVPAPNPDYPQDIHVVTGTQTVTLSDGTNSESYSVSLGSLELAKIGNYQDYIYKSGDDWYIHKETGKTVFTGDEAGWNSTGLTTGRRYYLLSNELGLPNRDGTTGDMVSDYFVNIDYATYYNVGGVDGISFSYYNTNHYVQLFFQTAFASVNDFKTWLSTNNVTVYYGLDTPTDTKITDSTLISQLDAIHQFLTRYGYQSSVSGSLPLIINQTQLT